jgi:hypothetical protein
MLNFTALAELSTRQIAETAAAVGLPANKKGRKNWRRDCPSRPSSNLKTRPVERS